MMQQMIAYVHVSRDKFSMQIIDVAKFSATQN